MEAKGGSSVSTSPSGSSVDKSTGQQPDVENSLGGVYAPIIREHWWQGNDPPPKAPDDWSMGRELHIIRGWENQGYQREDLVGALSLYEDSPATLAIAQKNGNRFILNDLLEQHRKARELEDMRVNVTLLEAA